MPAGQGEVEFFADAGQLAGFRGANGRVRVILRMACLSGAGGPIAWNTDALALYVDPGAAPLEPAGLAATAASSSAIGLAWTDNANDETGFLIERRPGSGGLFLQVGTAPANATAYTDPGLAASTAYVYRVRATNPGGESPYSGEATATTPSLTPSGPAFLNRLVLPR